MIRHFPTIILLSMFMTKLALAQSAQEIADRASAASFYQGDDGRADVTMAISRSNDDTRKREMIILRKNTGSVNEEQHFYVFFNRPSDVNKTSFLVYKKPVDNDDRWLYLPALDTVRRIATTDERTSFVGSHYFYEDISGRASTKDEYKLLQTTENYYTLEGRPKSKAGVEFTYFIASIHRTTFLPIRVEYYDANGTVYRTYEAVDVSTIQGIPTVTKSRMSDNRVGGFTEITFSKVRYNIGLPEDVFSERSLRTPPRKYLR